MDREGRLTALSSELQACRQEIGRLHRRCDHLERQLSQGLLVLAALQSALSSLERSVSSLRYLVVSVFNLLKRAVQNFGQELRIFL